ncbi:MAG: hypothetical protein FD180_1721 [Planctomycetota bacterium]|nr:MAG: hypothetical protein FD180_1721 [Planctomycetota bacterium]
MLRIIAVAAALAWVCVGCGKKDPTAKPPASHSGNKPVGTGSATSTQANPATGPNDPVKKPPVDIDNGKPGWMPVPVPDDQKDLAYTSVFHLFKSKETVYLENLERFVMKRSDGGGGTGSSLTAANQTEWDLVGGGIMEEAKKAPDKTDLYYRIKGKRTMTKKFGPPPGMVGEKQEWVMTVEEVVWKKSETQFFHEMTILEEELWDDYVSLIEDLLPDGLKAWQAHQTKAEDLGWGLSDRERDRTKKPFHALVSAVERISAGRKSIDAKSGDVEEAIAWMKLILEWSHFPGSVVSGDLEEDREKRSREALAGKVRLLENQFRDRLKSGLSIKPEEAGRVLKETDGTVTQKFCVYAADAGKFQLSAEAAMAVFGAKEKVEWKQTTLSLLKTAVTTHEGFFAGWPDDALAAFPGRLKDAVLPFTKGQLIPSRNAAAVLEAVKKAKPSLAGEVDAAIAELKKK